ncbi:polysaccharide biosynthesis protein [Aurantimonas sp. MSK8Z-1]|uniref:nucleoside-diphosphate sugar epimerase/dehydratase n=1 Tax=Mangrovibrevibacter kandeliae TaxID=2968473 RepID=UPI00211854DD|nr:nucleoside-diphosphate sugar epimerase/dehydratase [Aurantimonas sp. MSK8Z-1]MCW4114067.1 polysaccharide biosynthesis protein [Aurantimonas sp. MSK8Z-1]
MHLPHYNMRTLSLRGIALSHDVLMGSAAFLLALLLRLEPEFVLANIQAYALATIGFGVVVGVVGLVIGMNRGVWRYASLPDLIAILQTASIAVLIFTATHFLVARLEDIPRSTLGIAWAFLVVFLASPRAFYRMYRNQRDLRRRLTDDSDLKRVLLVGAGDNAETFIKVLGERGGPSFAILGIIDERGRRIGRFIRGVPILGTLDDLPQIIDRFAERDKRPHAVILTRDREDYEKHARLPDLVEAVRSQQLELMRLPSVLDAEDFVSGTPVRPLQLKDLLQRKPLELDMPRMASLIEGKVVMITGAGGSIGSELARRIAALKPQRLVLLDASEANLYNIDIELQSSHPQVTVVSIIGNVREKAPITRIVDHHKPDILFHAAALKHVPIVEAQPLEGLHTNAIGTRNVVQAAVAAGVGAMVMISTDKAVNPVSVMGASKRLAEMYCQAMDFNSPTRFVTVRFGNVLGSVGSVVPRFERQLKDGGPLTVTHPEVERFFMTIQEACLLVLQAAAHGVVAEIGRGRIFILDMGAPVKIADLARNMIRLSGLRPDHDVRIVYTGLRPGEKLFEELADVREQLNPTSAPGILSAFPRPVELGVISRIFDEIKKAIDADDRSAALRLLGSTVAGYKPADLAGPQAAPALEVVSLSEDV